MRLRSSHHFLFSLLLLCGLAGQVSRVEAATTCSGTNTYATNGPNPTNFCKNWCQNQTKFASVAPNWSAYCLIPAANNFCNDAGRVGAYTTGTSWFTQCGLTTPALAYADPVGNAWCKTSTNFTNVLWATNCKPAYCTDVANIGTVNFFNTNGCAAGGVYVSSYTKAWCDTPANYATATWNTQCRTLYCAAPANAGTADWFLATTCGAPAVYTSTTTGPWCKNSANFGNANWAANCQAAYCIDGTQVGTAGGVWFTGCGYTPATAYGNATAKTWCDNTANFSSVVGSNWDTYCRSSYCAAPANMGTVNFFNTNGCAAGGVYVNPTTKNWCLTLSNAGMPNWNTYCRSNVCVDPAIIGTPPWFLTTTCGSPTAYTSLYTGPWCKTPANFGNANWAANCGTAYCADQTQGAVAGGAWFTQCGVPTPYTAVGSTNTWCQNAANFGTANWITYCQAAYCTDGAKVGTAAWFGTNTCGTGGVYVNPTTKAWCDTSANYGTTNWNTYCKTPYCAAPANAGTADWFLATTCGAPTPYTSSTTASWCKTPANFTDPNWAANCGTAYCADQTQGAVAGGAWFTQCGVPTPYTATGSTSSWCKNSANFGNANWATYCSTAYCADQTRGIVAGGAWFTQCGVPTPYTATGSTGTWCLNSANFGTTNWNTYCKTEYCADIAHTGAAECRANQTITVTTAPPATATLNSTFPVAATASSGLSVAITVSGNCTIAAGVVTITGVVCTVYFNQAGDANYFPATQVINVATTALLDPVQVSAGFLHTCALDSTGVYCWGRNNNGQTNVPVLINPVQVSAGDWHTCALDSTGVHCWGFNDSGQINVPTLVSPVQVSAGNRHVCALDNTGVHCWGAGTTNTGSFQEHGQSIVPPLVNPMQVSAGGSHTCALDDTGVHCWGLNTYGQTTVPALVNPVQVSAGSIHTCALADSGVHCWGNNQDGQSTVPALINPVQVSAGGQHTCALDNTGVHCWGRNDYGQTMVPALVNPVQVSAGGGYNCALDDTGVHCWGRNDYGQVANFTAQYTQASQAITLTTAPPVSAMVNSTFPVAATASSGLSVAITASGGCTFATGTITMLGSAIDCTLNFNQAGNVHYFAATQITSTVTALADADNDAVADISDNCRLIANANQLNMDADTFGDACDGDIDGDGVPNGIDANPLSNATTTEIKLPLDGTHKGAAFKNAVRR